MRRVAILVLPTLHFLLCFAIGVGLIPDQGEWGVWFYVYLLDFPISVVPLLMHPIPPTIAFGVVGTAYWYFVSLFAATMFTGIKTAIRKRRVARAAAAGLNSGRSQP